MAASSSFPGGCEKSSAHHGWIPRTGENRAQGDETKRTHASHVSCLNQRA